MSRPFDLLLDMDDVIADLTVHLWHFTQGLGIAYDIDDISAITHRFSSNHVPCPDQRQMVRDIVESEGFFRRLPVMPGAVEGVQSLLDAGINVTVCSKPLETSPSCASDKYEWLREHFPMLASTAILAPDKNRVVGDVLLDDAPPPSTRHRVWSPVVFPAPFNSHPGVYEGLPRWSWGDDPMLFGETKYLVCFTTHPGRRQAVGYVSRWGEILAADVRHAMVPALDLPTIQRKTLCGKLVLSRTEETWFNVLDGRSCPACMDATR